MIFVLLLISLTGNCCPITDSLDSRKFKLCFKVDSQVTLEVQAQALSINCCETIQPPLLQNLIVPYWSLIAMSHGDSLTGPLALNSQLSAVHSPLHTTTLIARLGPTGISSSPQDRAQAVGNHGTLSQTLSPPKSTMLAFLLCPPHIAKGQTQRWSTRSSDGKHAITPLHSGIPIPLSGNPRDLTGI